MQELFPAYIIYYTIFFDLCQIVICDLLLYLVDISGESVRNLVEDFNIINVELKNLMKKVYTLEDKEKITFTL